MACLVPLVSSGLSLFDGAAFHSLGNTVPPNAPEHENELGQRGKWNAAEFAQRYGLKLVGANFPMISATDGV